MPARVLYWFRTDLRLDDSPALMAALGVEDVEAFYPVWCFDPEYVWKHKVGTNRWQFLLQSMSTLSSLLTSLNPAQRLLVLRGKPEEVLPMVWKEWGITHLVWERDSSGYARKRDAQILQLAKDLNPSMQVITKMGHNLIDPELVLAANGGKATMTLQQWKKASAKVGSIPKPLPAPTSLPPLGSTTLPLPAPDAKGKGKGKLPTAVPEGYNMNSDIMDETTFSCFNSISGPSGDFSVPTHESLGLPPATTPILGGAVEANRRLEAFLSQPLRVATFSKPNTAPTSLDPSTTLLSPYIKFGCLSVRVFWWRCKEVVEAWAKQGGKGATGEPENIFGQLEFREMYYVAELGTACFDRVRGNPVCRYMNWKLPNQYTPSGELILPRPAGDPVDEERFLAFKEGRTGYPWIDATMRQLRQTGWIHHLARHSLACFSTRGQLYLSWERGAEVFDEYLLDWDPASNSGNWMWLSCSAFFTQYFRVYGLVSWPMKTDKTGQLVRKYCPELAKFPDKYIYSPHLAPPAIQSSAGCIIGKDYPFPIIPESSSKAINISRIKIAYSEGLHGDHPDVLSGVAGDRLEGRYLAVHGKADAEDAEEEVVGKGGKRKLEGPMDAFVKKGRK